MIKLAKGETYEEFVKKFEPKKTTDDCYTPPAVYDAVLEWVMEKYELPEDTTIVRPFYPGGDYQSFEYPEGCVVVDNPPFSILAKILDWYQEHNIRYFLFAPALTIFSHACRNRGDIIICRSNIVYDNNAIVNTCFITNLRQSEECLVQICGSLTDKLTAIQVSRAPPKLEWPKTIYNSARLLKFSQSGRDIALHPIGLCSDIYDKDGKKHHIFGGGIEISPEEAEILEQLKRSEEL